MSEQDAKDKKWPRVKTKRNNNGVNHAYEYLENEDKVTPLCWDYKGKRTTFLSQSTKFVGHRPGLVDCGLCQRIMDSDN